MTYRVVPGLFKYIELEDFLSDRLGIQVDLVTPESLKPYIGVVVRREAVPL